MASVTARQAAASWFITLGAFGSAERAFAARRSFVEETEMVRRYPSMALRLSWSWEGGREGTERGEGERGSYQLRGALQCSLSLSLSLSHSHTHTHTHTHLGGSDQGQSSRQHLTECLRELGRGLCLVLWRALGGRHHLTAGHVQSSRTRTEVTLQSLVAGATGTGILGREGGREGGRGEAGREGGREGRGRRGRDRV